MSSLIDQRLAEAVAGVAQSKVGRLDELAAKQQLGHKSFWVSLLDEDLVNGAFATDHPFVRYALQPGILRILGDFMHELPQLSDVLSDVVAADRKQAIELLAALASRP